MLQQPDVWDEVLRTGTHTDRSGKVWTFSEYDLERIARHHTANPLAVPLVIGHPQNNAPAFGWVDAVKCVGSSLYVKYHQLNPEFVGWVKRGLYKKKSVALFQDFSLRHVGYLGAATPAIKGLCDVSFADGNLSGFQEFEFAPDREKELEAKLASVKAECRQMEEQIADSERRLRVAAKDAIQTIQKSQMAAGDKLTLLTRLRMRENASLTFCEAFTEVTRRNPGITLEYQADLRTQSQYR